MTASSRNYVADSAARDGERSSLRRSVLDKLGDLLFMASIAFLAFVGGAYVVLAEAFPHKLFSDAYRAAVALYDQNTRFGNRYETDLWQEARTPKRGVTTHDPQRSYPGFTLYTSGHAPEALLISPQGEVVHKWKRSFRSVWDQTAAVRDPQPESHIYFRKAHVYPNGDLLAIFIGVGDTPWGYGMVKLDRNSQVIWKYLQRTHHDFAVAANGSIYLLTHELMDQRHRIYGHLKVPYIDDFLVILSPEGKELKKISLLDAVAKSPYARLANTISSYTLADPLHTNSVDLIGPAEARVFPFASEGQVLLSFRELGSGTLAVLDVESETIVWATRGPWIGQHDPDILPNGNILLFDNNGHFGDGGRSRVMEFDPKNMRIAWSYTGTEQRPFASVIRSAQQRLPNGNTLITESDGGRLFEVTRDGRIVWEYINPVRHRGERYGQVRELIPVVSWGQRVDVGGLTPEFLAQLKRGEKTS